MAVLCGAISVVMRAERILTAFANLSSFADFASSNTLTTDCELVRIGFVTPSDAMTFAQSLEHFQLRYVIDGKAKDLIIIDHDAGPIVPCEWLEFGRITLVGFCSVVAARHVGSTCTYLAGPLNLRFRGFGSTYTANLANTLQDSFFRQIRCDCHSQVYLDPISNREIIINRPREMADTADVRSSHAALSLAQSDGQ